jgi:hypothetical protein
MSRYKGKAHQIGGTRDWEARIVVGRGSVPRQILGTIADVQCRIGPGSQVDGTRVGYTEGREPWSICEISREHRRRRHLKTEQAITLVGLFDDQGHREI